MGGTTFKVSVIRDGRIERNFNPVILRHNLVATKIWVESMARSQRNEPIATVTRFQPLAERQLFPPSRSDDRDDQSSVQRLHSSPLLLEVIDQTRHCTENVDLR
jgi:hypothetical protein